MLYKITALFISLCLLFEPPVLLAEQNSYVTQGIQAAKQALKQAGDTVKNINQAVQNGQSTVNVPGLSNPFNIPLKDESDSFRNTMENNASDWQEGEYDPAEAGVQVEGDYLNNPESASSFSNKQTGQERSDWGANLGYNTVQNSMLHAPYDASAYANDNYIWQSYYDLWNGNNPYVNDLTRDLNCKETVTTTCHDRDVQDCYEDACFGFETPNAASCLIYYDDQGNLHDECEQYKDNPNCVLLSEECQAEGELGCSQKPCYPNCSIPSANGGSIDNCCGAIRVYLCMDCSQVGGTPDPDWSQCPPDWKVHEKCAACLIDSKPAQPTITFSAGSNITTLDVEDQGDHFHIDAFMDNPDATENLEGYVTVEVNKSEYFQGGYITWIGADDGFELDVENNRISCGPSDCGCGDDPRDETSHNITSYLSDGTTEIEIIDRGDCNGGGSSWARFKADFYVTQLYYCPQEGYTYNPDTGKCELHKKAEVTQGPARNDDCSRFANDPNCHLVSTSCIGTDDDGNCYLYEYRYRCCSDIGPVTECSTTRSVECAGISCIGFNCRPEFTEPQRKPNDAEKASWFISYSPFSEGESLECVKKSLLFVSVDCCRLDDMVYVTPLDYFRLADKGVALYRNVKTLLPRVGIVGEKAEEYASKIKDKAKKVLTGETADYVQKSTDEAVRDATEAISHRQICSFASTVFRYANLASFLASPDPMEILTDPAQRELVLNIGEKVLETAAEKLFGEAAKEALINELSSFASEQAFATLGKLLSAVGVAITAYEVLELILTLILGGCDEEDMQLAVKKKLGTCHYVGSYKEGGGLFSIKKIHRVYCCFKSPSIRIMVEQVRSQVGSWGSAEFPNCSGITPEDLSLVDWNQIKMDQINAYRQKAGLTTDSQIIEQGESGGYGVQYVIPENPDQDIPERRYKTIDEAGARANERSQALQGQGFAQPH